MVKEKKRFYWIDTLKGFAAILVIILHFWERIKTSYAYIGNENILFQILDFITKDFMDI